MFRRVAKRILDSLEKVLPKKVFDPLLAAALSTYRWLLKAKYQLKMVSCRLTGRKQDAEVCAEVLRAIPYSLVGIKGLEATYRLGLTLNDEKVGGNYVELGVARGGAAALLGKAAFEHGVNGRRLWLFDSFEGLPDATEEDYVDGKTGEHVRPLPKGSCLGTVDDVKQTLFSRFHLPEEGVELVKGWFQDTVPVVKDKIGPIALLRIDGDWYESTKVCLENLYGQVVPGGYVVVDDYESCYGCKKAVDEFIETNGLEPEIVLDGRGGCYFRVS